MKKATPPKALDTARRIVEVASDKLASDIVLLDASGICGYTDYFVIVSGESTRQLEALADHIERELKQNAVTPLHREGKAASGWVLLDYGDVIVHMFSSTKRAYYNLDEMWNAARPVMRLA